MKKNLRTLFINLPHRNLPDNFPPYGAMAVITALHRAGYVDTSFYNMDVIRPTRQEALDYITSFNPDVLAISSPVSTGYEGCKFFSEKIRKLLPDITVILGGNLAASAEIILRKTCVDLCVLGEGEKACCQLFDEYFPNKSTRTLKSIKGLAFMANEELVITGYAEQLSKETIFNVNWDILDEISVRNYFPKLGELSQKSISFKYIFPFDYGNIKASQPERLEKTIAVIPCSKGCFNRCTYCHRFIKGIRFLPPEIAISRIKELIDRFNVGAINFSDECFGANPKWLRKFCELIKPLDLLWKVGGMRVDMVNPEIISMMKAAGCRSIIYGMESGSENILKIMEKKVDLHANYKAAEWTLDSGLYTIPQLVIGMPGETSTTITETAEFIAHIKTINRKQNPKEIGINFAQALPGTPLYEFGRSTGKIGLGIDTEEDYLQQISDREAADWVSTINFTDFPRLILLSWPFLIRIIVNYRYIAHFGKQHYRIMMASGDGYPSWYQSLRQMRSGVLFSLCPSFFYFMRRFIWIIPLISVLRTDGSKTALALIRELVHWWIKGVRGSRQAFRFSYKSLRKILLEDIKNADSGSKDMEMLRTGR